jgi:hypothetical protein
LVGLLGAAFAHRFSVGVELWGFGTLPVLGCRDVETLSVADSRLKLDRAKEHFESLAKEIETFITPETYPLEPRFNENTGWKTYHVRITKPPPQRFGLLAGEVVDLIRSSLDLLVYRLAIQGSAAPGKSRRQFPIFLDATEYMRTDRRGRSHRKTMLRDVRSQDRAIIDGLQPYHRVSPDRDPLAILKALRDAYEHREIATAVVLIDSPTVDIEEIVHGSVGDIDFNPPAVAARPLADEAEIAGFRLSPDPRAKVKVDIDARFNIAFEPVDVTMHEIEDIYRYVCGIIDRFDPAPGAGSTS